MHYYHTTQSHANITDNAIRHSIVAASTEDAEDFFVYAKNDLLSVNNWKQYCPSIGIAFELTNNNGYVLHRHAHTGDNIRMAGTAGTFKLHIDSIVYDDYPDADTESITLYIGGDASFSIAIERSGTHLSAVHTAHEGMPGMSDDQLHDFVTGFVNFEEM